MSKVLEFDPGEVAEHKRVFPARKCAAEESGGCGGPVVVLALAGHVHLCCVHWGEWEESELDGLEARCRAWVTAKLSTTGGGRKG